MANSKITIPDFKTDFGLHQDLTTLGRPSCREEESRFKNHLKVLEWSIPVCRSPIIGGWRLPQMNKMYLTKLRYKNEAHMKGQQEQVSHEEYRNTIWVYRAGIRKANWS